MKSSFGTTTKKKGFDTLHAALKDSLKKPYIGVTQGGSSRKNGGCRVAATMAQVKPYKPVGDK